MARIASSHETSSRLTIATYSRSRPSSVSSSMPEGCGHHGVVEAPDGQDWACSPPQKYPDRCLSLSQSLKDDTRSCLMAGRQARRSRTQSGGFVSFRDAHDGPVRGRRRGGRRGVIRRDSAPHRTCADFAHDRLHHATPPRSHHARNPTH